MILKSGLRAGSSVPVIQDLDLSQNKLTAEQFEAPDALPLIHRQGTVLITDHLNGLVSTLQSVPWCALVGLIGGSFSMADGTGCMKWFLGLEDFRFLL